MIKNAEQMRAYFENKMWLDSRKKSMEDKDNYYYLCMICNDMFGEDQWMDFDEMKMYLMEELEITHNNREYSKWYYLFNICNDIGLCKKDQFYRKAERE